MNNTTFPYLFLTLFTVQITLAQPADGQTKPEIKTEQVEKNSAKPVSSLKPTPDTSVAKKNQKKETKENTKSEVPPSVTSPPPLPLSENTSSVIQPETLTSKPLTPDTNTVTEVPTDPATTIASNTPEISPKTTQDAPKPRQVVAVAFDQASANGFRQAFFYPFVNVGEIPVSENYLNDNIIDLPNPIPPHWQVVSVNRETLINECHAQGKLEAIDWTQIPHQKSLIPSALETCGIGYTITGTVLAYSIAHKYGTPPFNWEALFNTDRYPGRRALPKQARSNLEIALLADGVPNDQIYTLLATPLGVKRALAKLETIKDYIVWWDDLETAKELLLNGDVAMLVGSDGAIFADEGFDNIGVVRDQVIYRMHYFAIPKKAPEPNLAYSFISFATQLEQQLNFSKIIPYGPANKDAERLLPEVLQNKITNFPLNLRNGILEDAEFYAKHGEKMKVTFQEWLDVVSPQSTRLNVKKQYNNENLQTDSNPLVPAETAVDTIVIDNSAIDQNQPNIIDNATIDNNTLNRNQPAVIDNATLDQNQPAVIDNTMINNNSNNQSQSDVIDNTTIDNNSLNQNQPTVIDNTMINNSSPNQNQPSIPQAVQSEPVSVDQIAEQVRQNKAKQNNPTTPPVPQK